MQTFTLTRSTDAIAVLVMCLVINGLVALPIWKLRTREDAAGIGMMKLCGMALILTLAASAFMLKVSYAEFVEIAVGNGQVNFVYPPPRPGIDSTSGKVKTVKVIQNRWGPRRMWILEVDLQGGDTVTSAPAGTSSKVVAAAEKLAAEAETQPTWFLRSGRNAALDPSTEEEVLSGN